MPEKVRQYIDEQKEALKKELLDALELFEYEKVYAPDHYDAWACQRSGYTLSEEADGKIRFYKNGDRIYPDITDEEYEQLFTILADKRKMNEGNRVEQVLPQAPVHMPEAYEAAPKSTSTECFAGSFLRVCAWILWIGGLILSIVVSNKQSTSYYSSSTVFDWSTFFSTAVLYGISGAFSMCMAGIAEDIRVIANALSLGYTIKEKGKK